MSLTGEEYQFLARGPYCFRINGQVYHSISQLQPLAGQNPKFSQIYVYVSLEQVSTQFKIFNNLETSIVVDLQEMLHGINPYARLYSTVGNYMKINPAKDVNLIMCTTSNDIDPHKYNVPTSTDIAMVIPVENGDLPLNKNIVIYKNVESHPKNIPLMSIDYTHPMYDPLLYVLIFPWGDKGWEIKCKASKHEYYAYRLMPHSGHTFNIIHRLGHLFQQYIVDMYSKIEASRLLFIWHNQKKLHAELYCGLADALNVQGEDVDGAQIGKKIILPSSFRGSARYQHQLFQDAMAIVRRYGKPDLFITFTCNPKWKEITSSLLEHQAPSDWTDIVAHVFKLKLKAFLHDIFGGCQPIFGLMCALIYVFEWQKRGPPHAHILCISYPAYKPRGPDDYDSVVSAEIPDPETHPVLYSIVTKFMMHGPCGVANPKSPCMVNGFCSKNFPKHYVEETYAGPDGYPHYRRRNTRRCINKSGVLLDNKYVLPYNPYLLIWYITHINVEICSSV